ncbi:Ig-like domain-containing protein [Vibrio vulnificus]|uniref:Ig-like domain-containing protein n=1 Tax=Vibrio vulnificus TaxID=672 RepID=UPI00165D75F3|nr:Ig-like domain-containing protein [Vibrio vulnificus]
MTGTTLADGSYDVTATVTDTAGNSDKAEQTIVVDTEIGTDGDDATKAVTSTASQKTRRMRPTSSPVTTSCDQR